MMMLTMQVLLPFQAMVLALDLLPFLLVVVVVVVAVVVVVPVELFHPLVTAVVQFHHP